MSFYRQSPTRSPYRSPVRILESEREVVKDQMNLRRALQNQSENRRLIDEISLLKIRLRKGQELQDKCEVMAKQIGLLTQQNDALARQLSERRYEIDRYRSANAQIHQRDSLKTNQLLEVNKSLELEIELLKKQRIQNNKLYENHIQKLELMLEDKVRGLDEMGIRFNDLLNEKEVGEIKFEEEINKMKNLLSRTSHEMERQFEYKKDKQHAQKSIQIQSLKRNFASQLGIAEDEIKKLKASNTIRSNEFQSQLLQNKNLKIRYEEEIKILGVENDGLRERLLKLEEINRSEVENIQTKYSNIHSQGQTSLKEQHSRQIKLLLDQIDKMKWLLNQKNAQIQNLVKNIRDQRQSYEGRQLQYNSEINTLKNKLQNQQERAAEENHDHMDRINQLADKLLRQSQGYHERVKGFNKRILDLQSQVKYKQSIIQKNKSDADIKYAELNRDYEESQRNLLKTKTDLEDTQYQRRKDNQAAEQYQRAAEKEKTRLLKNIQELEVKTQEITGKLHRAQQSGSNNEELLRAEIGSLRETVGIVEQKLSEEQKRHAKEMKELSERLTKSIQQLQKTQRKTLDEVQLSKNESIEALNRRVDKVNRQKDDMQRQLVKYVKMYESLDKYFPNPHQGALFDQKSKNSTYEVLSKVVKSTLHVF